MSRFDYVQYDEAARVNQSMAKDAVSDLENSINQFPDGRAKSLALTKLEETYMWVGKMIRDDQVARGGDPADKPERGMGVNAGNVR